MTSPAGRRVAVGVVAAAAAVLAAVGLLGLLDPAALHESTGSAPPADAGALSEARAAGAALVGVGALALVLVRRGERRAAAVLAGVVHLSYVVGRLVSWSADGGPGSGLALAGAVELALGLGAVAAAGALRDRTAPAARARLGGAGPDRVSSPAR